MKKCSEIGDLSPGFTEVALKYVSEPNQPERVKITSPEDAYEVFMDIWDKDTLEVCEQFWVILLSKSKEAIGWCRLSSGGKAATIVEVGHVVLLALLGNASSLLVAHNHPSGNRKPSHADTRLTKQLGDALKLMGLQLDDHLILTRDGFYSFRAHQGQL